MFFRKKSPLPQVGTRAPEFRLARLEGGEVALEDLLATGQEHECESAGCATNPGRITRAPGG